MLESIRVSSSLLVGCQDRQPPVIVHKVVCARYFKGLLIYALQIRYILQSAQRSKKENHVLWYRAIEYKMFKVFPESVGLICLLA
jgi:hypothetical protein